MALEGDEFDDGDFPMGAGDLDSYVLPTPPQLEATEESSLAGPPSTSQFHAIDWSYLNFPICKSGLPPDFAPSSSSLSRVQDPKDLTQDCCV